jgi:hypothetical protein
MKNSCIYKSRVISYENFEFHDDYIISKINVKIYKSYKNNLIYKKNMQHRNIAK